MVDQVECLWSLLFLLLHLFHALRKSISMSLCSNSAAHCPPPSPLSRKRLTLSAHKRSKEASDCKLHPILENSASRTQESIPKGVTLEPEAYPRASYAQQVPLSGSRDIDILSHGERVVDKFENKGDRDCSMLPMPGLSVVTAGAVGEVKISAKPRKRPLRIVVPESCAVLGLGEAGKEKDSVANSEVEGVGYCLVSRKGRRQVMEDGYGVIPNILGDSKQAFFGVFDGHGGRAAVDFVSENLGKNILMAISQMEEDSQLEVAIKAGYLATDRDFLSQGLSSGACAATALLRNGDLHVSNVGDCRVVMSKKGVATAITSDHRAGREDERIRIENSGGYVTCRNGTWRVHDSLAVSRAIGDGNMKEWIISEPETEKLRLTPDCEFLILASDGLWDKVTNQEAVDVVSRQKNSMESCKDLVDLSSRRGSRDDITVMVVDFQRFVQLGG